MTGPVERGPNYDWKHEAEHYRQECDKLRDLLRKMEISAERAHHDGLVAGLREAADEAERWANDDWSLEPTDYDRACWNIAKAIRALINEPRGEGHEG